MKKTFSQFFKRFSPETQQHIKLFGIVMGILIIVLGGIVLFFGNKDMIADAFKPGEVTPTPSATPTIIFDKDILGIEESQNSQATPTKVNLTKPPTATPSKSLTPTPTQTPSPTSPSSTSTPLPTSVQATSTPTSTSTSTPTSSQNSPDSNSLYLFPNLKTVTNGQNLEVELRVSSSENINAVSAKISFPKDLLDFQTVDASGGVFELQAGEPGGDGLIKIDRATVTPVTEDKSVVKIVFKTKSTGNVELKFEDGTIIKPGNPPTNVIQNKKGGTYTIIQ